MKSDIIYIWKKVENEKHQLKYFFYLILYIIGQDGIKSYLNPSQVLKEFLNPD